jgi:hypothetical protein
MRLLGLLMMLGCGRSTASVTLGSVGGPAAEAVVAGYPPLEAGFPTRMARERRRLETAAEETCRQHDHVACHRAINYRFTPQDSPAYGTELENCRNGDLTSCRTLHPWVVSMMAEGMYASACVLYGDCRPEQLRAECARGMAPSCRLAGKADPLLIARAVAIAIEGCQAGIISECHQLDHREVPPVERARALTRGCLANGGDCIGAARFSLWKHDRTAARYYLEIGCQLFDDCLPLLAAYRHQLIDEPAGRLARVQAYTCASWSRCDRDAIDDQASLLTRPDVK